jgi:pentatricopeptide repeat protein
LCKKGEIEKALSLLVGMLSKGLEPDAVICNTLIDRLCKKGEIGTAMDFLNVMISKGFNSHVLTYSSHRWAVQER